VSYFARRGAVFVATVTIVGLVAGVVHEAWRDTPADGGRAMTPADDTLRLAGSLPAGGNPAVASAGPTSTASGGADTTAAPFVARTDVLVDPASFGQPYSQQVPGVLTFRGNPTRSYYGTGPMPRTQPQVLWKYGDHGQRMCGESSEYGVKKQWCGTGWTGQPAVFERDGRTWLVFGAYDYNIHFVDALTGVDIIPPFHTDDLAKGNVTVDPDGYPLVYEGSRDNYLRVIAFDGSAPRELYKLNGRTADRMHNDDWDAAPLVLHDYLLEGGENSWFHGIKLNRGYAADGTVTVAPTIAFRVQGWDQQLIDDLGNKDPQRVSLEASVSVSGDTAWLDSSGGLVQGWDLSSLRTGQGEVTRTFRYWTGDDSDSSIVPDDQGFLYVGVEVDRATERGKQTGQMIKLDPSKPDNPVVWKYDLDFFADDGVWSTPIISGDVVLWTTKPGFIYALDRTTGALLWKVKIGGPSLSSPVLVDGVLIQGDGKGVLHGYDFSSPRTQPTELWSVQLGGNIESTPVVWNGRIYVGTRDGYEYCIGSPT